MTSRTAGSDRHRLVTCDFSGTDTAVEGVFKAFYAIGIDIQRRDRTLNDWIDIDSLNNLHRDTARFTLTFTAWNYPVEVTPDRVSIYPPRDAA